MMRRHAIAAAACVAVVVGCAKAPEARPNATATTEPSTDAGAAPDARVPGLPMPQKFPHFVWDAAGAPPPDPAGAR